MRPSRSVREACFEVGGSWEKVGGGFWDKLGGESRRGIAGDFDSNLNARGGGLASVGLGGAPPSHSTIER
jgi:hypothetical protein